MSSEDGRRSAAVEVRGLTKVFEKGRRTIWQRITRQPDRRERFIAVKGIDLRVERGEISSEGKRAKRIVIGKAETKVSVKTMSGDLEIRASGGPVPESSAASTADQPADRSADVERTEPMRPPEPSEPPMDVRELLARVAHGEIDVDAAAAALDARRER